MCVESSNLFASTKQIPLMLEMEYRLDLKSRARLVTGLRVRLSFGGPIILMPVWWNAYTQHSKCCVREELRGRVPPPVPQRSSIHAVIYAMSMKKMAIAGWMMNIENFNALVAE